jgi:broad specificity phosphatase PhoE
VKLDDVIFFFLRHGETAGNKKNIYRAWSNDPLAQLNATGQRDTVAAGKYLATIGAPIELIIADSLDRVQESAENALQSFPSARVETVRSLHPLNMGDWTLKDKDKYPVEPFLKDPKKRIPGGETLDEFNQRQQQIFQVIFSLAKDFPGGRLLVVAHGSNTAYLYNHVFNKGEEKIGYEGLVNPGGIYAATATGLVALTKSREEGKKSKDKLAETSSKVTYPPDHQPGIRVPKGGSMCANCEYLGNDKKSCTEENFIKWNGSEIIPGKIDEYCSDWYEPKEKL